MTTPRTAIWRLTMWYVLIIMVISVGFSTAIYQLSARHIRVGLPPQRQLFQDYRSRFPFPTMNDAIAEILEERYQEAMDSLRLSLLGLNLFVFGGSTLVSYFLAKRTLHPIEQAIADQRRFAADASHELRTPLAAMKAEIEVALRSGNTSQHTKLLHSSLEEIGKLENLSTALLRLARHDDEAGRAPLSPVELSQVVTEAVQRVEKQANTKNISLSVSTQPGRVNGEHAGLVELFVVVLDNAIKYSAEQSTVELSCQWGKSEVVVTITDHGVGIPAADVPHIFERFYRADPSRSKHRVDGHGLGLSIAQQIVERHHGEISVTSTVGLGTTVTVRLPVA